MTSFFVAGAADGDGDCTGVSVLREARKSATDAATFVAVHDNGAAYTVDVATRSTKTKLRMLPSIRMRDFIVFLLCV